MTPLLVDGRCPSCGLDLGTLQPLDAVVAVRSLPRRWSALLAVPADDQEDAAEVLARRPPSGSWSVLEQACRVVLGLQLVDRHVRSALWSERPSLDPVGVAPAEVEGACARRAPAEVEADLGAAVERVATTLEGVPGDAWLRPAVLGGRDTTVLGLARAAAHDGTHHLREAQRTLDQVRGRPAGGN